MTEVLTGLLPEQILNVSIDGNILDKSNYTIIKKSTESSTVISFNIDYMKTLSIGQHTVEVSYVDINNNTTENRRTIFKIEEPIDFSGQCSPECQNQIDELKTQVKDLQSQIEQLQLQISGSQSGKQHGSGINNGISNNNSTVDFVTTDDTKEQNTSTTTITNIPITNSSNEMNVKSVQTGDNLKITVLMFICVLSFYGIILCVKKIRSDI